MKSYIINLVLRVQDSILEGHVNKDKHNRFYPSPNHSYLFNNLITALYAIDCVKERYGVISYTILELDRGVSKSVEITDKKCKNKSALESFINSMINYSLGKGSPHYVEENVIHISDEHVNIEFAGGSELFITKNNYTFHPSCVESNALSSLSLDYTNELVNNLVLLAHLYWNGESLAPILNKYSMEE